VALNTSSADARP